jgi:molybdopterin-guanine dinucleotide biosynthesis protein A
MGRDKALVEVDGVPMVRSVAAALHAAGCVAVVAIGGDRAALEALGLVVVDDLFPGEGPLGGVLTALAAAPAAADAVVVVACDLPQLTAATIAALLAELGDTPRPGPDAVVARTDRPHPTCAVWRRSATAHAQEAFASGERRLGAALALLSVVEVDVPAQDLNNVNTPGDLPQ